MSKVELLATFHGKTIGTLRKGPLTRDAVFHVRFRRAPSLRIECTCGVSVPYVDTMSTIDDQVCYHIVALYTGELEAAIVTEFGREMFQWRWAQQALERST